jgi:hypothetical protein
LGYIESFSFRLSSEALRLQEIKRADYKPVNRREQLRRRAG